MRDLRELLRASDPAFWDEIRSQAAAARTFEELLTLGTLRRRAVARGVVDPRPGAPLRIALVAGYSLHPLQELLDVALFARGLTADFLLGEYDNYAAELLEPDSTVYAFAPQLVVLWPNGARCRYSGALTDARARQQAEVDQTVAELQHLCRVAHERSGADVVLCNFMLPGRFDLGPMRGRTLGAEWTFKRAVNLALGLDAPPFVQVCDLEFLSARHGTVAARDDRLWLESKQPGAPDFLASVAREIAHVARSLRGAMKKVLALDLDNTLWGGVIGDDGVEGIELGDTNARGQAFKSFQAYVASLKERGVLLGVCSKNDLARAEEPFERHPEMVLRRGDIVSFKANWNPKSDSLREMAAELNLGLDSFVFVDDNPAEIEIVNQFLPEVATILLGPDPADYRGQLEDSRYFEPLTITAEDAQRTALYKVDAERRELLSGTTDMDSYLASLAMEATIRKFTPADVPRIAQLINKSNQFNLTTRRRTEGEVARLAESPEHECFAVRLADRFGDHGLIAVVVLAIEDDAVIDTWLMSCRVLKRQVEEETTNEIFRLARSRGVRTVRGLYLPTAKNDMVRDLLPRMGWSTLGDQDGGTAFRADVRTYVDKPTHIRVVRKDA